MPARGDPVREWREQYGRRVLNIDFTPQPGAPFRTSFKPIFDDLRIGRTSLSPGITFRDHELVKDGDDSFSLVISQSRRIDVAHCGHELRLGRGDATLLRVCETGSVGSHVDFGYLAVIVPRQEIAARGACLDGAVMTRLMRQSDAFQLLRAYIRLLEKHGHDAHGDARGAVRRHVIDLIELAATPHGAVGESALGAVAAARLAAALDCIATRFHEPGLSVTAVAHSQGISPRYLQRLMEASGDSFTGRVTELRLQRAFAQLSDPAEARRISDVALRAGFSDISRFSRLFRARFGDTPSAVRAQARRSMLQDLR